MAETNEERWVSVVGYEGLYEVSDQGRVRSLDRIVVASHGVTRRYKGRMLRVQTANLDGRPSVRISRQGQMQTYTVAALEAAAFLGPRPPGMYVLHANDVPFDNRLCNLRYGTPQANADDKVMNGGHENLQKETCPRGHELAAPNLVPSSMQRRFARNCLACSRASTYLQNHPELDMQATSDAYYCELLRKAAAVQRLGAETSVRDHLLVQPNLVVAAWRNGKRKCLACKRGWSELHDHPERDLIEVANRHYRLLMESVDVA